MEMARIWMYIYSRLMDYTYVKYFQMNGWMCSYVFTIFVSNEEYFFLELSVVQRLITRSRCIRGVGRPKPNQ